MGKISNKTPWKEEGYLLRNIHSKGARYDVVSWPDCHYGVAAKAALKQAGGRYREADCDLH